MRLTKNFAQGEFELSETARLHNIDNTVPEKLIPNLKLLAETMQKIRDLPDVSCPVFISSGYRGPKLNKLVGGVDTSAHSLALAADFSTRKHTTEELFQILLNSDIEYDQIIQEFDRWIHLAVSTGKPRRQALRATKNARNQTVYTMVTKPNRKLVAAK